MGKRTGQGEHTLLAKSPLGLAEQLTLSVSDVKWWLDDLLAALGILAMIVQSGCAVYINHQRLGSSIQWYYPAKQ
jgi:hypothetical protein